MLCFYISCLTILNIKLQPNKVFMRKLSAQKWQTNGPIGCYSQQIWSFKNSLRGKKNSHWVQESELQGELTHTGLVIMRAEHRQVLLVCWRDRQRRAILPAVKKRYYNWHPSCVPALLESWLDEQKEGRAQIRWTSLAGSLACSLSLGLLDSCLFCSAG